MELVSLIEFRASGYGKYHSFHLPSQHLLTAFNTFYFDSLSHPAIGIRESYAGRNRSGIDHTLQAKEAIGWIECDEAAYTTGSTVERRTISCSVVQITGTRYTYSYESEDETMGTVSKTTGTSAVYYNDSLVVNSGQSASCTATPKTGYKFAGWYKDDVLVEKDRTITLAPQEDAEFIATFEELSYEDWGLYFRWISFVVNGEHEYRFSHGKNSKSTTLTRYMPITSTGAQNPNKLCDLANDTPERWKVDNTYYANYFPLPSQTGVRQVGAIREGYELIGWKLAGSRDGLDSSEVIVSPEAEETIYDIAVRLAEMDAPFHENSAGNYRMAFLQAIWGALRSVSVVIDGAVGETPEITSVDGAAAGKTVSLSAQTTGLKLNVFSEWSVVDSEGNAVEFDEDEDDPGAITFTMPDSDVGATAIYEPLPRYDIDTIAIDDSATVAITPEEIDDDDGGWIAGETTIVITPDKGKILASWQILSEDGDVILSSASGFSPTSDAVTISLIASNFPDDGGDLLLTATFDDVIYIASAEVDAASAGALSVAVENTTSDSSDGKCIIGDTLRYTATLAEGLAGYAFEGWYLDGKKVSSDPVYERECDGDVTLVAKAKVQVAFAAPSDGTGTVKVTGVDDSGYATLGASVTYALTVSDGYFFIGWYDSGNNPTTLPQSGYANAVSPLSFVAHTSDTAPQWKFYIYPRKFTGETFLESEFPEEGVTFDCVTGDEISSDAPLPTADDGTTEPEAKYESEIYSGVSYVRITAPAAIGESLAFRGWYEAAPDATGPQGSLLSPSPSTIFLLVGSDRTLYPVYGEAQNVKVDVAYASSNSETEGVIGFDGVGGRSTEVMQGQSVTLVARPHMGYVFVGWLASAGDVNNIVSTSAEYALTVLYARTVYAYFKQDPDAIYEWQGSDKNKVLVWRSKTYAASKPYNPSAARVDARGYRDDTAMTLTVDMFSSPDAEQTARMQLVNIKSQDARRLPVRRPERYMQVEIKADAEVDTLLVGTSMGGLAV